MVELTKPTIPRKRIARAEVGESSTKSSLSNGIKRPRRSSGSDSPAGRQRGEGGDGPVSVPDSDEAGAGEDEEEEVEEIDGGEMLDENGTSLFAGIVKAGVLMGDRRSALSVVFGPTTDCVHSITY